MEAVVDSLPHIVQAVDYSYGYLYYTELVNIGTWLIVAPPLQLFLFNFFNNWAPVDIIWFGIEFAIGIYTLVIMIAHQSLQRTFVYFSHYVMGANQFMLLLNLIQSVVPIMIWLS